MPDYERHPLSQLWGDIPEDQFAEMLAAFRECPTRQMITLFEGQIVDGWHRYKMCLEAGLEPFFKQPARRAGPSSVRHHTQRLQTASDAGAAGGLRCGLP